MAHLELVWAREDFTRAYVIVDNRIVFAITSMRNGKGEMRLVSTRKDHRNPPFARELLGESMILDAARKALVSVNVKTFPVYRKDEMVKSSKK